MKTLTEAANDFVYEASWFQKSGHLTLEMVIESLGASISQLKRGVDYPNFAPISNLLKSVDPLQKPILEKFNKTFISDFNTFLKKQEKSLAEAKKETAKLLKDIK